MLIIAMAKRNNAETDVPTTPPASIRLGKFCCRLAAVRAITIEAPRTTVE